MIDGTEAVTDYPSQTTFHNMGISGDGVWIKPSNTSDKFYVKVHCTKRIEQPMMEAIRLKNGWKCSEYDRDRIKHKIKLMSINNSIPDR